MRRVRFAPSPTGSLHVGNALTAAANRAFGDWLLLRIDDTDPSRTVEHGEREILRDLEWLGIAWDEGPVRQSERQDRYRDAAERLGSDRFGRITLVRPDGTATYHLASVVDDIEYEITHVIRGSDHRPNEQLHRELTEALGAKPPEYVHHGLVLGPHGGKLSKRDAMSSVADLRDAGIPAEAVRAYLDELGLPKHDVQLDLARIHRLAVEAIAAMPDEELAAHVGVSPGSFPRSAAPGISRKRTSTPGRSSSPSRCSLPAEARPTLERFKELVDGDAHETVRELKAAGGDLRALRLALTGRDRGPELWAVIHALPREEALRRVNAAL